MDMTEYGILVISNTLECRYENGGIIPPFSRFRQCLLLDYVVDKAP